MAFASNLLQNLGPGHLRQYPPNPAMVMKSIITMNGPNGMMSRNQLTTINQSQLSGPLSLNMAGPNITHTSPSPPASKSATPSPSSSINEDEQDEGNRVSWINTFVTTRCRTLRRTPRSSLCKSPAFMPLSLFVLVQVLLHAVISLYFQHLKAHNVFLYIAL